MTRMPRVCISIVASAFQYGWAPTLMPATTTLISPPACVNSTIRRSTAAIQSMFSVPLSIAIRAPEESENHSSGTPSSSARSSAAMIRRHSGSASAPSARVGSPISVTRVMPSGWRSVKLRSSPTTIPAGLVAGGRSTGTSRSSLVEVELDERAGGLPGLRPLVAAGGEQLDDLGRVQQPAAPRGDDPQRSLVQRLQRLARRRVDLHHHALPRRGEQAQHAIALGAVGFAQPAADEHHLDAQAGHRRRHADADRADLRQRQVDRRPDVQEDAVPLEPAARLAVGLEAADSLERRHDHPLELGQRGHPPVGVAQRRQVAHLRQREQPLVRRGSCARRRGTGRRPRHRAAGRARTATAAPAAGGATSSDAARGAPRPRPGRRHRAGR